MGEKLEGNVKGKYYVTDDCVGCSACVSEAPENFKMDVTLGKAIVFKQPENDDEMEKCESAKNICPVSAIHDDGE